MDKIKFKLVDGEPVCDSDNCPRYETCIEIGDKDECIPGLRQLRDEALRESEFQREGYEKMRDERDEAERANSLLAPLSQIAERMDGQDNRATADPIFIVQQRRRICGIDTGWTDNVMWIYDGDRIADTREQLENFLHENDLDEDKSLESGDLIKTGYMDIFEFVQPFFSHKAADDYIEVNRHRMIDPRVYVDSAYRNEEWQTVRGVLLEMVKRSNPDA